MIIQHNMPALVARGKLAESSRFIKKSSEKLSSGYRINRAADDAAGLAVSEKIRSQMRGIKQAIRNTQDGAALIQTFEGALSATSDILKRMKKLAVQSANGEYSDNIDRQTIQTEYLQLCDELNHIAQTDFNGLVMLCEELADISQPENTIASQNITEMAMLKSASSEGFMRAIEDMRIEAAPLVDNSGVQCGALTVKGGVKGVDFDYDETLRLITVKSETPITISGTSIYDYDSYDMNQKVDRVFVSDLGRGKTANITLEDLNIQCFDGNYTSIIDDADYKDCAFQIEGEAQCDVVVTLKGVNTLHSGYECAGLQKSTSANFVENWDSVGMLTIQGDGTLAAYGGMFGAGIGGGGSMETCQNIVIKSGTILAYGGNRHHSDSSDGSAGIGAGYDGNVKNIRIEGGKVLAVGSSGGGAGIGGSSPYNSSFGLCNDVTISGGLVVAVGGSGNLQNSAGAGIGGGGSLYCGTANGIKITGKDTVVIAQGGFSDWHRKYADDLGSGLTNDGDRADPKGIDIPDYFAQDSFSGEIPEFGVTIKNGTKIYFKDDGEDEPPKPEEPDSPVTPESPTPPEPSKRPAYTEGSAEITYADGLILQVNSRSKDSVMFTFKYDSDGIGELKNDLNCTAKGLGLEELSLATQEKANYAIDRLDHALCKTTMIRASFGSAVNRLEYKRENLAKIDENLTEAEFGIRDTDMALELMSFTKGQVIMNAAQSMLAQANSRPQNVLQLLGVES